MRPFSQKRIKDYNVSGAELNDDQKRSLATLPVFEGILKELEDVRKAIEVRRLIYCIRFFKAIDRD